MACWRAVTAVQQAQAIATPECSLWQQFSRAAALVLAACKTLGKQAKRLWTGATAPGRLSGRTLNAFELRKAPAKAQATAYWPTAELQQRLATASFADTFQRADTFPARGQFYSAHTNP